MIKHQLDFLNRLFLLKMRILKKIEIILHFIVTYVIEYKINCQND